MKPIVVIAAFCTAISLALLFPTAAAAESTFSLSGFYIADPVSLDTLGKRLVAGTEWVTPTGPRGAPVGSLVVARIAPATGTGDITFDEGWGNHGIVRIPIGGKEDRAISLMVQPDGKVLVLGATADPTELEDEQRLGYRFEPHMYLGITRLNANGSLDPSFNDGGRLVFRIGAVVDATEYGWNSCCAELGVALDGKILVHAGSVKIADLTAGGRIERVYENAPGQAPIAIELHAVAEFVNDRDQYFLTANPDEALALDRGLAGAWARTGYAFHAFVPGAAFPVCRFFGLPEYGLGNHFYTADAGECALLANQPQHAWRFEGADVFRVEVPDHATGTCAPGRKPLYRLVAPRPDSAHRFTTSLEVVANMLARGWKLEGWGAAQVAMCAAP